MLMQVIVVPVQAFRYKFNVNLWSIRAIWILCVSRTFANIPLPMGTPDAMTRLKKIHNNFDKLRDSPIPALVWLFSPLYMGVPKWLINLWGTNRMTTMTISSFPGPKKPILFFDRWYIEDTMYWLPRLRGNACKFLALLTTGAK